MELMVYNSGLRDRLRGRRPDTPPASAPRGSPYASLERSGCASWGLHRGLVGVATTWGIALGTRGPLYSTMPSAPFLRSGCGNRRLHFPGTFRLVPDISGRVPDVRVVSRCRDGWWRSASDDPRCFSNIVRLSYRCSPWSAGQPGPSQKDRPPCALLMVRGRGPFGRALGGANAPDEMPPPREGRTSSNPVPAEPPHSASVAAPHDVDWVNVLLERAPPFASLSGARALGTRVRPADSATARSGPEPLILPR